MPRSQRNKTQSITGAKSQLDLFSAPLDACASVTAPVVTPSVAAEVRQETIQTEAGPATAPTPAIDVRLHDPVTGSQKRRGRPPKVVELALQRATDDRRLLDVREAAIRLGLSKSTLDKMRCSGRGPRFIRATEHAIRYDPEDLRAFTDERRLQSTSQTSKS